MRALQLVWDRFFDGGGERSLVLTCMAMMGNALIFVAINPVCFVWSTFRLPYRSHGMNHGCACVCMCVVCSHDVKA